MQKSDRAGFLKKLLIWKYSQKCLQNSPKSNTDIFLKNGSSNFLGFGLKLVLNMTFNLSETYFSEKISIWKYLTSKSSKKYPNWGFWLFSRLCIISFLDFAHNDRWAWCLVAFVQFAGPVNVLLFNTFFPAERCGFTSHCLYRDSLTLIYQISSNRCRPLAAPLNTRIEVSLPLNALLYSNKHHTS